MLAVVKTRPEPGIEVLERPEPPEPGDGEVLIEVAACGICGTDLDFHRWELHAGVEITLPRIIGHEVAGTIVRAGRGVERFRAGERVVCETGGGCGRCHLCRLGQFNQCPHRARLGQLVDGGMARHVVVPELSLYAIPPELPFDEAAVVEPAGVALHAIERADLKPGDAVAVVGPGPIGLLCALLARAAGATPVVVAGLPADAARLRTARELGCETVDAAAAVEAVRELTGGHGADLAIEASGGAGTVDLAASLVRAGGQVVLSGLAAPASFDSAAVVAREITLRGAWRRQPVTWQRVIRLMASRTLDVRPLITHRLPIAQAEEAFELLLERRGIKAILVP